MPESPLEVGDRRSALGKERRVAHVDIEDTVGSTKQGAGDGYSRVKGLTCCWPRCAPRARRR